jgi:hypothetical protein
MRGYSCGTYSGDDNDKRQGATNQSIDGNKNAMEKTLANIASVVNKTEAHFDVKDLCIIGSILNPEQIDHNNATKAKQRKSIGRCRLIENEARFDIFKHSVSVSKQRNSRSSIRNQWFQARSVESKSEMTYRGAERRTMSSAQLATPADEKILESSRSGAGFPDQPCFFSLAEYSQNAAVKFINPKFMCLLRFSIAIIKPKFEKKIARFLFIVQVGTQKYR